VPQSPELQLLHELPLPAMRVGTPESEVLKQAKVEGLRRAGLPQPGQATSLSAWLRGRSFSNLEPHSGQRYSYIGIMPSCL
jgi:hypothetical protein